MATPSQGLIICKSCGKKKPRYTPNPKMPWCMDCGRVKQAEYSRAYRKRQGNAYRNRMAARYHARISGMSDQELKDFRRRECEKTMRLYKILKDAAFQAYGGYRCNCCGETEPLFLSLDHIDNNGAEHRRQHGLKNGERLYRWLKKNEYPSGFQVLCMNCNTGKYHNGGICPHQTRFNDYSERK